MPQYKLNSKNKKAVISLGGSIINPGEISIDFLKEFRAFIKKRVSEGWKFIIITGGGALARGYIEGSSAIMGKDITKDDMDWLGIHATRFNAHLVRTIFRNIAQPVIITDPDEDPIDPEKSVVIGGGSKPGWSTDHVSTTIAARIDAPYVINLSNIKQAYTDDPNKNSEAKPIDNIKWDDFCEIVGDTWEPGLNTPFDPIASKLAKEKGITVLIAEGTNLKNLDKLFNSEEFVGTVISN
ncbi:MAG: UMP kinase [Candidatus Pacebacteria bacterium]|mgnify:CR=1 FL=1|jgi:uridylate kinase|nr:UMP kinase [Candidatus Paceibacterota bacterium]MBT4652335.1 UMP kinase [Candidatus Paceibacterota bacterium]MBT6756162.1 UMP kinase [Candidatus Paceibacterota bacterium]MBT6921733.1 UMP kinase [Candidatus Paceibacterota bacterium]